MNLCSVLSHNYLSEIDYVIGEFFQFAVFVLLEAFQAHNLLFDVFHVVGEGLLLEGQCGQVPLELLLVLADNIGQPVVVVPLVERLQHGAVGAHRHLAVLAVVAHLEFVLLARLIFRLALGQHLNGLSRQEEVRR